jgi:hypothetical protein
VFRVIDRHAFDPIYCDVVGDRLVATCKVCGHGGVLRLWRAPSRQGNAGWAHRSGRARPAVPALARKPPEARQPSRARPRRAAAA